jgi:cell division protein FtsI/penicillin-binding protein 2
MLVMGHRLVAPLAAVVLLASACVTGSTTATTTPSTPTTTSAPVATIDDSVREEIRNTALAYLEAWADGDAEAVFRLAPFAPADIPERIDAWRDDLEVESTAFQLTIDDIEPDRASVGYRATLTLTGIGPWSYEGAVELGPTSEGWVVDWSPSLIYPRLADGDRLVVTRVWADRAPILGTRGTTLVADRAVKVIGVVPQDITDLEMLLTELEAVAGIPPEVVTTELERPGVQPDWFLPVGRMRVVDYVAVQGALEDLDGVLVRDETARLGPVADFADHFLGTTGEITAELLDRFGAPYAVGDVVGLSGLELAMEPILAGSPRIEIRHVNQFGRVVEVLHEVPEVSPNAVRTTLSIDVQIAAEAALEGVELPAALVVIDIATGEVRATASRPLNEFDRALGGLYPPGSTFKVITATALLEAGMRPADATECPDTVMIGGREFRNAGDLELGEITLREAFAASCNTTFADLAAGVLATGELDAAARRYGFNQDYGAEITLNGGIFPDPPDLAGRAAAAIGQGQVLTSPLHMASVAAAAGGGVWRTPRLLETDPVEATDAIDPTTLGRLQRMMRSVVLEGTGTNAAVGGEEIYGKTGSAEFGEGDESHAWFIGFWRDLAFAVVVEGGGGGGAVAAPIAAAFVEAVLAVSP